MFKAQSLWPCLRYRLLSGSLFCTSAGAKTEPGVRHLCEAQVAQGICQGFHNHAGCCTTRAHCAGFTTFPESLTVLLSFCLSHSLKSSLLLKTTAAMTGTPIQLLMRWARLLTGRVITCRNIRNGQINVSPYLVPRQ